MKNRFESRARELRDTNPRMYIGALLLGTLLTTQFGVAYAGVIAGMTNHMEAEPFGDPQQVGSNLTAWYEAGIFEEGLLIGQKGYNSFQGTMPDS